MAVSLRPKAAKRLLKRAIVPAWTCSLPLISVSALPRSSPAKSLSVVRRVANSKAKFGAAEKVCELLASNCIQRAGRCKNAIGLINTARR